MSDTEMLSQILEKLDSLEARISAIEGSCSGMDRHINWVHRVYSVVQNPLNYLIGKSTPEPEKTNILVLRNNPETLDKEFTTPFSP